MEGIVVVLVETRVLHKVRSTGPVMIYTLCGLARTPTEFYHFNFEHHSDYLECLSCFTKEYR